MLEDEIQTPVRRVGSVPPEHSTTTAIIHQEQSPWLSVRDGSGSDAVVAKNVLQRAKSMNINTGKSMKTARQACDDTNVRYRPNWTRSIEEASIETELDAVTHGDDTDGLAPSSSTAAAAAAATNERNAVSTYTGTDNNGSPQSEGQSDYQQPMSVASDQWSSYDPCVHRDDQHRDDEMTHVHAGDASNQCYDADVPLYVNTSELAADAAGDDDDDDDDAGDGGDGGSSEYMQVPAYSADDEADNVYLSLLDIVSIAERQIEVSQLFVITIAKVKKVKVSVYSAYFCSTRKALRHGSHSVVL